MSNTPGWEMEKSRLGVTTTLCFNVAAMVAFSMLAASTGDAAKSKSLAGLAGLISAGMASLAGFGFCCYIGIEFAAINMAAPFLLLGIGVDDTFVMLSAWRRAPVHDSVPKRLGKCYSDAAVSITVTSLTNFLSFMIGGITPFPCVRIFCFYAGISVAFIFVWHCTLFGGFLALSGYAEKDNRHGLFPCLTVTPKSLAEHRNCFYRFFMTGGINPDDPGNPKDNREHLGMVFFRDHFGQVLTKGWVKALVLIAYAAYVAMAIWGVSNVREGLEKRNTASYDSYSVTFYDMEDEYFKLYGFTISVTFTGPDGLDFSDPKTQERIETVMQKLENSTYIDGKVTQSWLRDYLDFIRRNELYATEENPALKVDTEADFARNLREVYFGDTDTPLKLDVEFSPDGDRIIAGRFIIQVRVK